MTSVDVEALDEGSILSGLGTEVVGRHLYIFDGVDSTNDLAFKMAADGGGEGTIVLAEFQRRGRGRYGRGWESPPGGNIYTSIVLRPPLSIEEFPFISILTAVSVAEVVMEYIREGVSVKWPNDILVRGRKLSGILSEVGTDREDRHFVVVGIGINLNLSPPPHLRGIATSLKDELGFMVKRSLFLRRLYLSLDTWYKSLIGGNGWYIRERWMELSGMGGRVVRMHLPSGVTRGVVVGLDTDGALLVKDGGGNTHRLVSGDISIEW